jgi:hypothetical protein
MNWGLSLAFSSFVSSCILWVNGPWINTDPMFLFSSIERYSPIHVPIIAILMYLFNDPYVDGLDYKIHHSVNALGITWCYWRNRYHGFLQNTITYEFSTPWLALYMITKNKWLILPILATYTYYRMYNTLIMCSYIPYVDPVVASVYLTNLCLNTYWYTKILRKCYVKLLQ